MERATRFEPSTFSIWNVETQTFLDGPELTQYPGYFDRMVRSQMCLFACIRGHLCVVSVCKCVVGGLTQCQTDRVYE